MRNASDFIIENGVLTKYIGTGGKVVIPENVTEIGTNAFFGCNTLTDVDDLNKYIAITSKSVSIKAFLIDYKQKLYSENLQEIIEAEKNEKQLGFIELNQADWKKLFTLRPFGYRRKDGSMITSYKGSDTYITVPAMIGKNTILAIDADAFSPRMKGSCGNKVIRKKIESVTIEEGVVVICGDKFRAGAFCDCSALAEINLPSTLVEIGCCSFSGCENLVSVVIPPNTRTIGDRAFYNCTNLNVLKLPDKLKKIEESTFENCKKLTIHAPAGSYAETYAKEHNIPFVAE